MNMGPGEVVGSSLISIYAEVSEWFKEAVLKTAEGQTSVGSNPTLSAIL